MNSTSRGRSASRKRRNGDDNEKNEDGKDKEKEEKKKVKKGLYGRAKKEERNDYDEKEPCRACNPKNPKHACYPNKFKKPFNHEEVDFSGIWCDGCLSFYHVGCVGLEEYEAKLIIKQFYCPECQQGAKNRRRPLNNTFYKVVLRHRRRFHDESETDLPTQVGTPEWMDTLFKSFENKMSKCKRRSVGGFEIITLEDADELKERFPEDGRKWKDIFLLQNSAGIELDVPGNDYDVDQLIDHYGDGGADLQVDTTDSYTGEVYHMKLGTFRDKFKNTKHRPRLYNILSLELSNTNLHDIIKPPKIYKDLSLSEKFFKNSDGSMYHVERFCLLTMGGSFTDFHVDFGGSSVWYHVARGKKVFYCVPPTEANLNLYEEYVAKYKEDKELFLGDLYGDQCMRVEISEGETAFIPAGWIHAVWTPVDSVVFGGNFLTEDGLFTQLEVHEHEVRHEHGEGYLFPAFREINWRMALVLMKKMNAGEKFDSDRLKAASALYCALKQWLEDDQMKNKKPTFKIRGWPLPKLLDAFKDAILKVTNERSPSMVDWLCSFLWKKKEVVAPPHLIDRTIKETVERDKEEKEEEQRKNNAAVPSNQSVAKESKGGQKRKRDSSPGPNAKTRR